MRKIWFSLIDVKSASDSKTLGDARGAYTNVIAIAIDVNEFKHLLTNILFEYGLELVGYERIEHISINDLSEELYNLSLELSETNPILLDDLQAYMDYE